MILGIIKTYYKTQNTLTNTWYTVGEMNGHQLYDLWTFHSYYKSREKNPQQKETVM